MLKLLRNHRPLLLDNFPETADADTINYNEQAANIAKKATADQLVVAYVIYGEAGKEVKEDKLGIGWVLRNRYDGCAGNRTYKDLAYQKSQFAPLESLRENNLGEFKAWKQSFEAAAEVLNSDPASNPLPGVCYFHDISISFPNSFSNPVEVQFGSGAFRFYRGIPFP
jgi:spore germination cell wall hydrolase CwlJ-like protein